ncbi:spore coat protein [Paenisporosarcina antarctica]|uniref:Spore coat protein n=1 Tax=Paenisporosarcina antarctica TaxID=417367 RepID=A0A4P7A0E4_9BACL|nr:spore coat protein [Paenisporosarcina antarctica]QBP42048.1 spore coat protein [Paenisporosarcina antarctica]
MSNLPEKPEIISNKVVDLLVSNAFRKNGIDVESLKGKLLDEQKQAIKELVEELSLQVDAFVKQKPNQ